LAQSLSRRGHDVHVYSVAATRDERLAPECVFHDVPAGAVGRERASARELHSFARNAARMLEGETFDAVHTRLPSTWVGDVIHVSGVVRARHRDGAGRVRFAMSSLRHPARLPLLLTEHRAVRDSGARLHAESDLVRDDLERYYGVDRSRIAVITPGIDLDEFRVRDRAAARRDLGLPDGLVIVFCGHDFYRKGLDRLIDAVARMRQRCCLVVVGGGPARSFAERADAAGVDARFVGGRLDPARFYAAADMFVLPTRLDMWGVTVLEAMACGVPAIVSGIAGVAAAVANGETGVVLPEPFQLGDLAAALDRLADDSGLRRRLASAARAAVEAHSLDVHANRVEAELAWIAEGRAGSPPGPSDEISGARGGAAGGPRASADA
jgi:glycosyltransferase involved in cell wall biosynthesis